MHVGGVRCVEQGVGRTWPSVRHRAFTMTAAFSKYAGLGVLLVGLTACEIRIGGTGDSGEPPDVTAPEAVGVIEVAGSTRQSVQVRFTAPADDDGGAVAGYDVRVSRAPIFESTFDQAQRVPAAQPARPGAEQVLTVGGLRPGRGYYVGVVAYDRAGNRSAVREVGPVMVDFDMTGAVWPMAMDDGDNGLGYQMASGRFGDDEYDDLVVAAPFKQVGELTGAGGVYLYRGGPSGLADGDGGVRPDVIIEGTEPSAQFGNSIAVLDWDGDGRDDLAVGAPFGDDGNGVIYIFDAQTLASGGTLTEADARVRIGVAANGGWFAGGMIGWTLAAGRFDDDGRDDLAFGVVLGGGGNGGVAIAYGGTAQSDDILLSDLSGAGSDWQSVHFLEDPATEEMDLFSHVLVNLGRTEGASDRTDDLAIGHFQGSELVVLRGRALRPFSGAYALAIDPLRDLVIRDDSGEVETYFAHAVGSIEDQDGDAGRDLVIGSYLAQGGNGQVVIASAGVTGYRTLDEVGLTEITGEPGARLGSAIASNAAARTPDVDGDGREDLILVGGMAPVELQIWYGGELPDGSASMDQAPYRLAAPQEFEGDVPAIGGSPHTAIWAGDVNGDGLEDLAWASWSDNGRDGSFELIWDDGM